MAREAIAALVELLEDVFRRDPEHGLLPNLADVREDEWLAVPEGGGRSIGAILEHVGWCKWMYEDYAFGPAMLAGDRPPLVPPPGTPARDRDELIGWLTAGHERLVASIRALPEDAALERDRLTNWGEHMRTRQIIHTMIAHDLYHAGEVNHLRALLQGSDRWPYVDPAPPFSSSEGVAARRRQA